MSKKILAVSGSLYALVALALPQLSYAIATSTVTAFVTSSADNAIDWVIAVLPVFFLAILPLGLIWLIYRKVERKAFGGR